MSYCVTRCHELQKKGERTLPHIIIIFTFLVAIENTMITFNYSVRTILRKHANVYTISFVVRWNKKKNELWRTERDL